MGQANPEVRVYILCGGWGSRLAPLTSPERPKWMLRVGPTRLLDATIQRFWRWPIYTIGLQTSQALLPYLREFVGGDAMFLIGADNGQGGTVGAIVGALETVHKCNDILVFTPADHVIGNAANYRIAINQAILAARESKDVVLLVNAAPFNAELGWVNIGNDGRVTRFLEKPEKLPPCDGHWIANMGVVVARAATYSRLIQAYWDGKETSFDRAVLVPAADDGRVRTVEYDGYWRDIGTLEALGKELAR